VILIFAALIFAPFLYRPESFWLILPLTFLSWMWKAMARERNVVPGELVEKIVPLDIQAFGNLVDPQEEAFLRARLNRRDFRAVQRQRLLAALQYVGWASHNAAILIRVGEAARHSRDGRIAMAGKQMVEAALQLRLTVVGVRMKLWAGVLLPGVGFSHAGLADHYERARSLAWHLRCLEDPLRAARLAGSL
jgi:hypothetical protein